MTVLQGNEVRGFTGSGRKLAVEAALVLVGLGVAFGISRVADQDTSTYEGPMVQRSLAMQNNTEALLEGNWPAPVGVTTYTGPMVDRSLAMEDNTDALIQGAFPAPLGVITYQGSLVTRSLAMEEFYKSQTYEGPMVDRSLAMEEFYNQDHFQRQNPR